jgi:hypothetical protein
MQVTDTASAGIGGVATPPADGGAVSVGDINRGGNVCTAIGLPNTSGYVPVERQAYGGDCLDTTAIADASGGNYNLAFVS